MDWRQKEIDELYGGDAARFEADWQEAVEYGRRHALHWEDLLSGATILPERQEQTHDLVERRLGYVPHASVLLEYEPYLRGLLQGHAQGQLTDEAFALQVEEHVKLVRNADMRFNLCDDYKPGIYESYGTFLPYYADAVKARLTRFLGYEPELKHSLVAELWLRKIMAHDLALLEEDYNGLDIKAVTLIKYREVLLEQGKQAADASPLFGAEPAVI